MKCLRKLTSLVLAFAVVASFVAAPASAKTVSSEKAENAFFYVKNAEGKSVLLKVLKADELDELSHGRANGENYYVSATDNYPTPQYGEARGFTVNELVDYVKSATTVAGADKLTFAGEDTVKFMATDGYGNYNRSWTWNELYGVARYYFESLYDSEIGWKMGWEIAGEDDSKFGITIEEYNEKYKVTDPYYEDKREVFAGGIAMTPILATQSYSGRTTSETLVASTEPGIAAYLRANGGKAAGSLKDAMTDSQSLRLMLPITEADLMAAHRTAYDNFKWIYNIQLDMANAPELRSLGTVAAPVPTFSLNGNTLTITFTCATEGANIYYGFEGAAQKLYTGPIEVDVSGHDLNSNPITLYAAAVKEGYDDGGMQTFKYPGMAPTFKTVYSGMTNTALVLEAADNVTAAEWTTWTKALNFISAKLPGEKGYVTLNESKYVIDNDAKAITFDASLFTETGSCSFIFHNTKYANKSVSVTMKKAAPTLSATRFVYCGRPVTVTFDAANYTKGLSVYVTGESGKRTMISSTYLDRTQDGKVTIKEEYFTAASTAMGTAGTYTLELVNNSFSPASQKISVELIDCFSDVPEGAWYEKYVNDLASQGVINGMGDGRFDPQGKLNWGGAMKLLMLSCGGYGEQAPTGKHWASGYMDKAVVDGLISAGIDPNAEITRLEFCRTAAKMLGAKTILTQSPFTDTDDPDILALYELGIVNGMTATTFVPDNTLTRAEISKVIWCILNLEV